MAKIDKGGSNVKTAKKKPKGAAPAWSQNRLSTIKRVNKLMPRMYNTGRVAKGRTEKRWVPNRGYPTSFVFDAEQYVTIGEIAYEEKMTRKELVYRLLQEGLKKYYSGELDMSF